MAFPPLLSSILLFNFHYMFARGSEFSSLTETGSKNLQTYIVHVMRPDTGLFRESENVLKAGTSRFCHPELQAQMNNNRNACSTCTKMSWLVLQQD
ncbi:hypothetical protein SLA2020_145650 [Shorea laevis]